MRVVFVGPPGAGKGTQAVALANKLGVPHISTGDMLRRAMASGTPLGKQVTAVYDRGELVSDDMMKGVVADRLAAEDCQKGFLLDGYPRTIRQVHDLEEILKSRKVALSRVIEFTVPDNVLVERIVKRAKEGPPGAKRSDDSREVAQNRLKVFAEQTAPLIAHYKKQGLVRSVDGVGSIDEVQQRVAAALKDTGRQ